MIPISWGGGEWGGRAGGGDANGACGGVWEVEQGGMRQRLWLGGKRGGERVM